MAKQPAMSALPALKAAVEAFQHAQRRGEAAVAWTQTLFTFGGCTYTLTLDVAAAVVLPSTAPSISSAAAEDQVHASTWRDDIHAGAETRSSSAGVPCPVTIRIAYAHAIPFAQLNLFLNCRDELSRRLLQIAPHCSILSHPAPPDDAPLQLTIPSDVTPVERDAALRWVAEWWVVCLLPVLGGLLCRCQAAEERQTLVLVAPSKCVDEGTKEASLLSSSVTPSLLSPAQTAAAETRLTQALIVSATPCPSLSPSAAPPSASTRSVAVAACAFEGTVSFTTCITSADAREAVLIRSYLDTFAEPNSASPVLLLVHESPQPPPELHRSLTSSSSDAALPSSDLPPYVWWCTMVIGPHHARQAGALEAAMKLALSLRHTILFHVHQESVSLHALLRQQLTSYASRF
ncbi:putative ARP2/3 complex subunit [Leptomonas pyrrhocoris]|uniref:Putative ARP2/3 complex subunit n=1 Tax=Leptomonas pyrrhocoris TaxID=157538 RepID=A0A0N0DSI4_LEPPY|nr:putative ARP2/3 complex subunit [Leptomonas pyrrhocoris]KPA76041.1 putative ARP2/3 complex subunit [Leptomonas pyrrhocoris]|eukprot:XP_015654480.1 putative ARP2/3 complex subunit [Leptomonas pyrrhocoris]